MRQGLKGLKEIKKYQSGTEMLIRRLPFQRGSQGNYPRRFETAVNSNTGIARSGGDYSSGLVGTVQSLHITCKESDHNAERCSADEMHKR